MPTTHEWNGQTIEIISGLSPRYWFCATETVVTVGGKEVARTGGFAFTESAIGSLDLDGKRHVIEAQVNASIFSVTSVPYVLRVDGIPIGQGRLGIERLGIGCLVIFFLASLCAVAAIGLFVAFRT